MFSNNFPDITAVPPTPAYKTEKQEIPARLGFISCGEKQAIIDLSKTVTITGEGNTRIRFIFKNGEWVECVFQSE